MPEAGSTKLYVCENPRCQLGGPEPGHFTDGLSLEGMVILTGKPAESGEEGTDYGAGVCPNCGEPGTEVGYHKSLEGDDA